MTGTVFLATDYGLDDEFVGVLHATIARVAPDVRVIDLSHRIAPYDVAGGAALLERAVPHLGRGVVCAVVDPGVGTPRRAVAVAVRGAGPDWLVGPDNGLLVSAAAALGGARRVLELARPAVAAASTFDGRDLFAPVAARLASGADAGDLGHEVEAGSLVVLATEEMARRDLPDGRTAVVATVRWVDRFGNVQLTLRGDVLASATTVGVVVGDEDLLIRVVDTFGDLDAGAPGLLCDANGAVALVVGQGSAAARFGLSAGDHVELVGSFGRIT